MRNSRVSASFFFNVIEYFGNDLRKEGSIQEIRSASTRLQPCLQVRADGHRGVPLTPYYHRVTSRPAPQRHEAPQSGRGRVGGTPAVCHLLAFEYREDEAPGYSEEILPLTPPRPSASLSATQKRHSLRERLGLQPLIIADPVRTPIARRLGNSVPAAAFPPEDRQRGDEATQQRGVRLGNELGVADVSQ